MMLDVWLLLGVVVLSLFAMIRIREFASRLELLQVIKWVVSGLPH